MSVSAAPDRPPSVDAVARSLADTGLPHPILVEIARAAIAAGDVGRARTDAQAFRRSLLSPVINATGVVLHTNLGRAVLGRSALEPQMQGRAQSLEFDLETGRRGSRQRSIGSLLARLCDTEAALVVNNNAAAVMLVVAALASGRDVLVSRGESVEIGGAFRVPEITAQSGARLVDVGTTNRTRLSDYRSAIARPGIDAALVLKVHPSNYRIDGFVEAASIAELSSLPVPVVADIGSGLIDAATPWLPGGPPSWLAGEPAARQILAEGAAMVMFSGDKLFGGPQAGIIAGRAELVDRCRNHPLARALRPGGLVLGALQQVALAYLERDLSALRFWSMVSIPVEQLRHRADAIVEAVLTGSGDATVRVESSVALPGAGSTPGASIDSVAVVIDGDHLAALRSLDPPIIARVAEGRTLLDLRTVSPADDTTIVEALVGLR